MVISRKSLPKTCGEGCAIEYLMYFKPVFTCICVHWQLIEDKPQGPSSCMGLSW